WAMIFPGAGPMPRHPSQLYEAGLEGIVLFLILWNIKDRPMFPGALICVFLLGYGSFRFFVEFFREPDPQLGILMSIFSMGQLLSIVTVLFGLLLFVYLRKKS
ncbi:MAG: prolipoprotein diacylglyceryl transferase, partial [Desulfobacterales bacterium]|nr:prolipoprotein diacylglyceryl transferase [Desulfobacterales bacterium]